MMLCWAPLSLSDLTNPILSRSDLYIQSGHTMNHARAGVTHCSWWVRCFGQINADLLFIFSDHLHGILDTSDFL